MRIALDIRYRVESGASTYIFGLLPELFASASGDVEFLYVRYVGQSTDSLPDCPTIDCPRGPIVRELSWLNWSLPRELRRHGVDLYHGLKLFGPVLSPVPMVHTAHSITRPRGGEFPMSLRQRAMNAYGNMLFKRSHRVIGVSGYVSDFLVSDLHIPRDRVRTVHPAVGDAFREAVATADPSTFDTPGLGGEPYIVCVGNIEYVKNHETAVRALGAIRDRVRHHLVIAGRSNKPAARALRRLIDQEGLADRVHLVGFLDLPTLVSCLARADLQVHPSLSEGLCIAVLEGMHAGVPIIGSAIPGVLDAMGDTGVAIEAPRDYGALARAILEWLDYPAAAHESARRGQLRADRFRWRNGARQTLEIYRECLNIERPAGPVAPHPPQ